MFMHREGIWEIYPTLCSPCRTGSPSLQQHLMQRFSIFTGGQRYWDREESDWSPAVQSHPGSRVEVTDCQGQEITCCQGLGVGEQMKKRQHYPGLSFGSSHFLFPGGPEYV